MKENKIIRVIELLGGTCLISTGIAFQSKAAIGMSPLSTVPNVLSLAVSFMTLGNFVLLWNVLFVLLQIPLEGKNYKPYLLLQIPLAFVLGYVTDFAKFLISPVVCDNYPMQLLFTMIGIIVIAWGVVFTVRAKLIMNGPEAFLHSLSKRTGMKFGTLKTIFDCSNIALAIILSLIIFHNVQGVREGTVLTAVITGFFVNLFNKLLNFVDSKAAKNTETEE